MANYGNHDSSPSSQYSTICRFGRDTFQEASKIANRVPTSSIDWKGFKYLVFDAPNHRGSYAERYSSLGKNNQFLCVSDGIINILLNKRRLDEQGIHFAVY